jgi:hypothetical protein
LQSIVGVRQLPVLPKQLFIELLLGLKDEQ